MLELTAAIDVATFRGNDARSDTLFESKGTTDGQHPIANAHRFGVAELCRRQRMIDVNFDNCQIRFGICADDFGIVLHARRITVELHAHTVSFIHHVLVGDDVSLGIDDYS